jgi:hypothetical protein
MKLPSYKEWLKWLSSRSSIFETYGSFLREQEEIFWQLHKKLAAETKNVWTFSAPTASGKTHVMLLLADFLAHEHSVAVVVPNNYLKIETMSQKEFIKGEKIEEVAVLSLHEYVVSSSNYDFSLVDEAHNLRASLELDTRVVKTFRVFEVEDIFKDLADRFLPPGTDYNAQKLSTGDSRFVLREISNRFPSSRRIQRNLTAWTGFIYTSAKCCEVKFIKAGGMWSFRLPKKKLILFSATPLSTQELAFYCGIDPSLVEKSVTVPLSRRAGQRTYLSVADVLNDDLKLIYLCNLLNLYPRRILVLFNNLVSCRKAHRYLSRHLTKTQVFHISSYEDSKSRMKRYIEYLKHDDGILLSSSNVFWEGISVKDLGLLVIADIPYPRPSLFELSSGQKEDARKLVLRRLKQGLGRIGRTENGGICVLMFDIKCALRGLMKDLDADIKRELRFGSASEVFQIVKAACS